MASRGWSLACLRDSGISDRHGVPARVTWDWDGFAEAQAHYADIGLAPPVSAP